MKLLASLLVVALTIGLLSTPFLALRALLRRSRHVSLGRAPRLWRSPRTLCLDLVSGAAVVARPRLGRRVDFLDVPSWRVPLELPMPAGLGRFLAENDAWVAGLLDHRGDLWGPLEPDWQELAEFLNRQLERAGVRRWSLLPVPLRLSADFTQQLAVSRLLASVWEPFNEWMSSWVDVRNRTWVDALPARLVGVYGDRWEELYPYAEWYASLVGVRLPRRTRKAARSLHVRWAAAERLRVLRARTRREAVSIEEIDAMNPYRFEELLAQVYAGGGWVAQSTPKSGDQGADVLLERLGRRKVIQAKLYSRPVGNKAVQEAIAARDFYRCTDAAVVTNAGFTRSAKELAAMTGVELVGREELAELLRTHSPSGARAA